MNKLFALIALLSIISCNKIYDGSPGVGGNIPSSFIAVKDSSFNPAVLDVVAGTTIGFINNTTIDKTIQSADSILIPPTIIPAGKSFIFKSNNAGSFEYFRKDKPAVRGIITLRP